MDGDRYRLELAFDEAFDMLALALSRVEAVRISGTNAEWDEASRLAKAARELMEAAGRALEDYRS